MESLKVFGDELKKKQKSLIAFEPFVLVVSSDRMRFGYNHLSKD